MWRWILRNTSWTRSCTEAGSETLREMYARTFPLKSVQIRLKSGRAAGLCVSRVFKPVSTQQDAAHDHLISRDIYLPGHGTIERKEVDLPAVWAQGVTLNLTALGFLWYLSGRTRKVPRGHLLAFAAWCAFSVVTQVIGFGSLTWDASRPFITDVRLPFGLSVRYLEARRLFRLLGIVCLAYLSDFAAGLGETGTRFEGELPAQAGT